MYFKTNKELTLAEFGVIATMIGLPSADYVTVDELAQLSADNIEVTGDILESLIAKGYVLTNSSKSPPGYLLDIQ